MYMYTHFTFYFLNPIWSGDHSTSLICFIVYNVHTIIYIQYTVVPFLRDSLVKDHPSYLTISAWHWYMPHCVLPPHMRDHPFWRTAFDRSLGVVSQKGTTIYLYNVCTVLFIHIHSSLFKRIVSTPVSLLMNLNLTRHWWVMVRNGFRMIQAKWRVRNHP